MDAERKPAEVFPLAMYLADELQARGWTTADLAARVAIHESGVAHTLLSIDMLMCVHSDALAIGDDMFDGLAEALDVSPEFLRRLDATWRENPGARQPWTPPEGIFGPTSRRALIRAVPRVSEERAQREDTQGVAEPEGRPNGTAEGRATPTLKHSKTLSSPHAPTAQDVAQEIVERLLDHDVPCMSRGTLPKGVSVPAWNEATAILFRVFDKPDAWPSAMRQHGLQELFGRAFTELATALAAERTRADAERVAREAAERERDEALADARAYADAAKSQREWKEEAEARADALQAENERLRSGLDAIERDMRALGLVWDLLPSGWHAATVVEGWLRMVIPLVRRLAATIQEANAARALLAQEATGAR